MIGDYYIFKNQVIGVGSFGQVFKGKSKLGNIPVAIKKLPIIKIDSSQFMHEALKQEVLIMKESKSPNIVQLYDFYITKNNYYLVQEFCDGDLSSLLKKNKQQNIQISQSQAIKMLIQICNGFLTLIQQGIIHRDLKPANILIKNNILKIGDFGVSKKVPSMNYINETCTGTPAYMSLQQLKCKKYTSKCDIWSIGIIFYEILHGAQCTPFAAKTSFKLVQNILCKPLHIQRKDLSSNTIDFIQKCLQIEQKDRISWDQVLTHPIFKNHFKKLNNSEGFTLKFQNKVKLVKNILKQKIQKDKLNINDILKTRKKSKPQSQMNNFEQFYCFLKQIEPLIEQSDAYEVFLSINENKSKRISQKQIQEWLKIQKTQKIMQKQAGSQNFIKQNQFVQKKNSISNQQNCENMLKSTHMKAKISRKPSINVQKTIKKDQIIFKFTEQKSAEVKNQKQKVSESYEFQKNIIPVKSQPKPKSQPQINKMLQNPLFNQLHNFLNKR